MNKIAYPQNEFSNIIETPRNIKKWMKAMVELYEKANVQGWKNSFDLVTTGWDTMEKMDFNNWVKFYQENGHGKYKTAQFSPKYIDNGPGSFIPIDAIRASLPKVPDMTGFEQQQSIDAAKTKEEQEVARKELVNEKLRALISRLSAAEKISTLPDVQKQLNKVLPDGVTKWFAALQELKREIQLVPIRSAGIIDSLILRNANRLIAKGDKAAARFLIKVAQGVPSTPGPSNAMGVASANPIDTTMGGQPITPSDGPANSMGPGPLGDAAVGGMMSQSDPAQDKTMQEFMKLLSGPGDSNDVSKSDDSNDSDDLIVDEEYDNDKDKPKVSTAQIVPEVNPAIQPVPETSSESAVTPVENDLGTTEAPTVQETLPVDVEAPNAMSDNTKDPFDLALENVKISDIISRLEGIASMFKNRQIARQLSIIDLMMDKAEIAPYFPSLAEAMKSSLESNQYCQSRIESILAMLRGNIATPMSEHIENEMNGDSGIDDDVIKANLAKSEEEEKARKEHRKQQSIAEEDAAMKPAQTAPISAQQSAINGEELAGPAQIESSKPIERPSQTV